MSAVKKTAVLWTVSAALFFINAASFILMPLLQMIFSEDNTGNIIGGSVFWASLIGAVVFLVAAAKVKNRCEKGKAAKEHNKALPGILTFFSGKVAKVADSALILSAAAFVTAIILAAENTAVTFTALFLMMLCLYAHAMLNGKIYHYIILNKEGK